MKARQAVLTLSSNQNYNRESTVVTWQRFCSKHAMNSILCKAQFTQFHISKVPQKSPITHPKTQTLRLSKVERFNGTQNPNNLKVIKARLPPVSFPFFLNSLAALEPTGLARAQAQRVIGLRRRVAAARSPRWVRSVRRGTPALGLAFSSTLAGKGASESWLGVRKRRLLKAWGSNHGFLLGFSSDLFEKRERRPWLKVSAGKKRPLSRAGKCPPGGVSRNCLAGSWEPAGARATVRGGVVMATCSTRREKLYAPLRKFGSPFWDEFTALARLQPCRRRRGSLRESTCQPLPFWSQRASVGPAPGTAAAFWPHPPPRPLLPGYAQRSPGGPPAEARSGPAWRSLRSAPSAQPPPLRARA